jgi:hypothetical protein
MSAIKTDARYGVDMTDRLAAYDAAQRSAREAYDAVGHSDRLAAYDAARRSAREAWEALACGDPLVNWIINNASGYRDESLQVLRALPATLAEMDTLADAAGWCGAWDTLRAAAIRDGVIA